MNLDELLSTLESPIVVRPTRRMTQGELESYLDKAADILRGNADHSEFRGYVFALLFYKRINDCFDEEVLTQVATLLSCESMAEVQEFFGPDAANTAYTWRLSDTQIREVLSQRHDFSQGDIARLVL